MMTATLVPRAPSSAITLGTVSGGVITMARSAGDGSSASERRTGRPAISPPFTFTRWISPLNPPASRLRVTASPTEPFRALAPIATTDFGSTRPSRLRVDTGLSSHRQLPRRHGSQAARGQAGRGFCPKRFLDDRPILAGPAALVHGGRLRNRAGTSTPRAH